MPQSVERKTLPIGDLKPFAGNPRKMSREAREGLRTSIDRFGLVQEIVVNRRTMHVVGGHQRLEVLAERGETEVPVALVDLDEDGERALNVALNNPKIQGEFTADLEDLLKETSDELLEGLRTPELEKQLHRQLAVEEERAKREFELQGVDVKPPPKMVWAFVGMPSDRYHEIADHLDAIARVDGVQFDKVIR